jgi:glycine dehydrogenase subunit 2
VFMITNPNTLGLFERQVREIADLVHEQGGLIYLDGANMNAILGIARPGDFGADMMHFNPHKTFSGPHGGGGPGAGPIAVRKFLEPYLPLPVVERISTLSLDGRGQGEGENNSTSSPSPRPSPIKGEGERNHPGPLSKGEGDFVYRLIKQRPKSIGRVRSFFGQVGVFVRAYCYIRTYGPQGLRAVSENAVLNANYLLSRVKHIFPVLQGDRCLHEFVATGAKLKADRGVSAMDVAKRLLDYGFHAPTVYFPLTVKEAMMIEPTETESKETLDAFAETLFRITEESPELLHDAPHTTSISRPDEVRAARQPVMRWSAGQQQ